jgi:hypothetical protein
MDLKAWLKHRNVLVVEKWLLPFFALGFITTQSWSQGTMQFAFDGPAYPGAPAPTPRGTWLNTTSYSEAGMVFWNVEAPRGLVLANGAFPSEPDNGTTCLVLGPGDSLRFQFSDLRVFDLLSFDAAEYSTNFPGPATLHVVGFLANAPVTATLDITTDGINDGTGPLSHFQTFTFGDLFRNIYKVEVTSDRFSLDNVVIGLDYVPEPSAGALVVLGVTCLLVSQWMRRQKRVPGAE